MDIHDVIGSLREKYLEIKRDLIDVKAMFLDVQWHIKQLEKQINDLHVSRETNTKEEAHGTQLTIEDAPATGTPTEAGLGADGEQRVHKQRRAPRRGTTAGF